MPTDSIHTSPLPPHPELRDFLATRRSMRPREMTGPGPSPSQLNTIVTTGVRVPDHGKLTPWRLVTFEGDARRAFGQHLERIWKSEHPDTGPEGLRQERERLMRAPLVIAVISTPVEHKIPAWEQELSAGVVCYNLCLAAQAEGYASAWLTEWPSFNAEVAGLLSMAEGDRVAGFIYIGNAPVQIDRPRPALDQVVSAWELPQSST